MPVDLRTAGHVFLSDDLLTWLNVHHCQFLDKAQSSPTEYNTAYLLGQADLCKQLMKEVRSACP